MSETDGRAGGVTNKKLLLFAVIGVSVLALAAVLIVVLVGRSHKNAQTYKVDTGSVVLTVEDTPIYENQFRFFVTLVLDQESTGYMLLTEDGIDRSATVKNAALNFSKEYVLRLAEARNAGLTLDDAERATVLNSIANEYEQFKTVGGETYEGDRFYDYYYGLTEDQYRDFWLNWALIEKFNTQAEAEADVSAEMQAEAYEYFKNYLYGRECTVLALSLKDKSASDREMLATLARELTEQLENGADMEALIDKHCTDEDLKANKGKVTVTSLMEANFPELYAWALAAEAGALGTVTATDAIYIVRAGAEQDFAALKDSDTMLEWTRLYAVDKHVDELIGSGDYYFKINDGVYNALDITELVDRAVTDWRAYYSSLETED